MFNDDGISADNLFAVMLALNVLEGADHDCEVQCNKVIIIDREMVITGSFNFTKAAEYKNAENVLFIKSKELAQRYLDNWKRHKEHAE